MKLLQIKNTFLYLSWKVLQSNTCKLKVREHTRHINSSGRVVSKKKLWQKISCLVKMNLVISSSLGSTTNPVNNYSF